MARVSLQRKKRLAQIRLDKEQLESALLTLRNYSPNLDLEPDFAALYRLIRLAKAAPVRSTLAGI